MFYCNAGEHLVEGSNFATNKGGTYRTCYECVARVDLARLIGSGNSKLVGLALHYIDNAYMLVNRPMTLRLPVTRVKFSTHTSGRPRRDIWFNLDGWIWYGFSIDNGYVYARRTKRKVKA